MCDGSLYKNHPLFAAHPDALQIILYYDDLEVCNPLGSNTKKHKIGACVCAVCVCDLLYIFL